MWLKITKRHIKYHELKMKNNNSTNKPSELVDQTSLEKLRRESQRKVNSKLLGQTNLPKGNSKNETTKPSFFTTLLKNELDTTSAVAADGNACCRFKALSANPHKLPSIKTDVLNISRSKINFNLLAPYSTSSSSKLTINRNSCDNNNSNTNNIVGNNFYGKQIIGGSMPKSAINSILRDFDAAATTSRKSTLLFNSNNNNNNNKNPTNYNITYLSESLDSFEFNTDRRHNHHNRDEREREKKRPETVS